MSNRESLWAGTHVPREARDEVPFEGDLPPHARGALPAAGRPSPAGAEPRRPDRGRRWRRVLAIGCAGIGLLGLGLGGGALLGGDREEQGGSVSLPPGGPPTTDAGRIYAAASGAVASVRVRGGAGEASGTGFLIDGDGTIVTNAHVVGEGSAAIVRFGQGDELEAEVLGTDPSSDLAALRVDPGRVGGIKPLALADSGAVGVGDSVVAIGHPFGLDRTATAGIVSGTGREITAPNGFQIDRVIQTDAAINPGNSGGPLLDARARVVGVNAQIASSGGGGNVGVGFAIPSNTVREVVPELERGRSIARPYLGVTVGPAPGRGALLERVDGGGPAAAAGLVPGADVILEIEGKVISEPDDVARAIENRRPGDEVLVEVERGEGRRSVEVELGARPARTP